MEIAKENKYMKMYFDKEKSLIEYVWLPTSLNMTEEELKENLTEWRDFVIDNSIKLHLLDTSEFYFILEPEVQEWIALKNVKPCVEAGLQKIATILPPDTDEAFISKLAMEQTMEESKEKGGLHSKYFLNKEEARTWLLNEYD